MSDARRDRTSRARQGARVRRHPRDARRVGTARARDRRRRGGARRARGRAPRREHGRVGRGRALPARVAHAARDRRARGGRGAERSRGDGGHAARPAARARRCRTTWRRELEELARGVGEMASRRAAARSSAATSSRADELSLTITVLGTAVAPLARAGARVGRRALRHRARSAGRRRAATRCCAARRRARVDRERFAAPRPRLAEARWLAERGATRGDRHLRRSRSPMRDISPRASGVAIELDPARYPCVDGVTPPKRRVGAARSTSCSSRSRRTRVPTRTHSERAFGLPLTAIGRVGARSAASSAGASRVALTSLGATTTFHDAHRPRRSSTVVVRDHPPRAGRHRRPPARARRGGARRGAVVHAHLGAA